jgi:hypothetical protein
VRREDFLQHVFVVDLCLGSPARQGAHHE